MQVISYHQRKRRDRQISMKNSTCDRFGRAIGF